MKIVDNAFFPCVKEMCLLRLRNKTTRKSRPNMQSRALSPYLFKHTGMFFCLVFCAILFVLSSSHAAPPKNIYLGYLALNNQDGALYLDLSASVDDEDGLAELLKDGANIEFVVQVFLKRERSILADKELFVRDFTWHISHDHLTREFVLQSSTHQDEMPMRDRNLSRLLQRSLFGLQLPLLAQEEMLSLKKDDTHYVLVYLNLNYAEIPPWLEKTPVFSKSRVVPRSEYTLPLLIR